MRDNTDKYFAYILIHRREGETLSIRGANRYCFAVRITKSTCLSGYGRGNNQRPRERIAQQIAQDKCAKSAPTTLDKTLRKTTEIKETSEHEGP